MLDPKMWDHATNRGKEQGMGIWDDNRAEGPVHRFGPWPTIDGEREGEFGVEVLFGAYDEDGMYDEVHVVPTSRGTTLEVHQTDDDGTIVIRPHAPRS